MKNLYDFPHSLMYIRRDFQLQQDKPYLAFTCPKATIKTLRTRSEICLKLKFKNKCTETTLPNRVLLSLLLTLNVFFTQF